MAQPPGYAIFISLESETVERVPLGACYESQKLLDINPDKHFDLLGGCVTGIANALLSSCVLAKLTFPTTRLGISDTWLLLEHWEKTSLFDCSVLQCMVCLSVAVISVARCWQSIAYSQRSRYARVGRTT
mmetsp:Transcript_14134/g.32704  ORF Transcript_14134/g.32704 Transcript_14134/m.32704 type:complete len:130 (-) Transcript_14134:3753-4142(-)